MLCPGGEESNAVGEAGRTSAIGQRALAIVSLVAVFLLAVALIGFLVRNGVYVVLGAAGFVFGVAGGWWAITKRAPRRWLGTIVLVAGAAALVIALLLAGSEDWESFIRALVCLALLAVAFWRRGQR